MSIARRGREIFSLENIFVTNSRPHLKEVAYFFNKCPDGGMVYTEDLKSSAVRLVGSSPTLGTKQNPNTSTCWDFVLFFLCAREDLNLHGSLRLLLRQVRLPISPLAQSTLILYQSLLIMQSLWNITVGFRGFVKQIGNTFTVSFTGIQLKSEPGRLCFHFCLYMISNIVTMTG